MPNHWVVCQLALTCPLPWGPFSAAGHSMTAALPLELSAPSLHQDPREMLAYETLSSGKLQSAIAFPVGFFAKQIMEFDCISHHLCRLLQLP